MLLLQMTIQCDVDPTVRMNLKSDMHFARQLWVCPGYVIPEDHIRKRDTQGTIMVCPANADLREGRNFDEDRGLVEFFQAVITRRQSQI